jgi:hypothetical protein
MADQPVEIKIKGIRQLNAGARRLFANIDQATDRDAVRVTAEQTAATVRGRVPHRTGRLAASVRAEHVRAGVWQTTMGAGLPYARFIEFGAWGGRRKGPRYVWPTAKRTERAFRKHCETDAQSEIRRMHWPTPH